MSKSKHLQLVSGVDANLYWLSVYVCDLSAYFVVCLCCMFIFRIYGEPSFVGTTSQALALSPPTTCIACCAVDVYAFSSRTHHPAAFAMPPQALAMFLVMWFYGVSVLPLVYCYSFLFDNATVGQISIIMFNLVAAFVMVVAHQIMSTLENTKDVDAVLVNFWCVGLVLCWLASLLLD